LDGCVEWWLRGSICGKFVGFDNGRNPNRSKSGTSSRLPRKSRMNYN
jgi:hypothetical protein